MINKIFSLYDNKAMIYMAPFVMGSNGSAMRALGDLMEDKSSIIAKHPSDFLLYQIGTYDDQEGIVEPLKPKQLLGSALEFKRPPTGEELELFPSIMKGVKAPEGNFRPLESNGTEEKKEKVL